MDTAMMIRTADEPLALIATDTQWMVDAACRAEDPELFFARPSHRAKVRRAKAVCADCPVLARCAEYALDPAQADVTQYGVWGGMTERDRRALAGPDQRANSHRETT